MRQKQKMLVLVLVRHLFVFALPFIPAWHDVDLFSTPRGCCPIKKGHRVNDACTGIRWFSISDASTCQGASVALFVRDDE